MTDDDRTTIPMSIPLSDGEKAPDASVRFHSSTPLCPKCDSGNVVQVSVTGKPGDTLTVLVRCSQCKHEFDLHAEAPDVSVAHETSTPMCPECGNCAVVAVGLGAAEGGTQTVRARCIQCRHEFDVAPVTPEL